MFERQARGDLQAACFSMWLSVQKLKIASASAIFPMLGGGEEVCQVCKPRKCHRPVCIIRLSWGLPQTLITYVQLAACQAPTFWGLMPKSWKDR